jgi:hypothetical protein
MTELHPAPFGEGNGAYFIFYAPKNALNLLCSLPPHINPDGMTGVYVHGLFTSLRHTQVLTAGDSARVNGSIYVIRHEVQQAPAGVFHDIYIVRDKS